MTFNVGINSLISDTALSKERRITTVDYLAVVTRNTSYNIRLRHR